MRPQRSSHGAASSGISRLAGSVKSIRTGLLGVLGIASRKTISSPLLTYLSMGVLVFQMLSFITGSPAGAPWPSALSPLEVLSSVSNLRGYMTWLREFITDVAFWLATAWVLLLLALMAWGVAAFAQNSFPVLWPLRLLRIMGILSAGVLYIPLLQMLMTGQEQSTWTGGAGQAAIIVLTVVLALVLILLACMFASVFYDSRILSRNPAAKAHGRCDVVRLAAQTLLVVQAQWEDLQGWLRVFLLAAAGVAWLLSYLYALPHYAHNMNRVHVAGATVYLWCLICFILNVSYRSTDAAIMLYIGLPFAIGAGVAIADWRADAVVSQPAARLNSSYEVELKARFMLHQALYGHHLLRLRDRTQVMLLASAAGAETARGKTRKNASPSGLAASDDEPDDNAIAVDDEDSSGRSSRVQLPLAVEHAILGLYRQSASRFRASAVIQIFVARFYGQVLGNRHMQLSHLLQAERRNPALDLSFAIMQARRAAEDTGGERISAMNRVAYEKFAADARKHVQQAAQRQLAFWAELCDISPDLTRLHRLSSDTNAAILAAEQAFAELTSINPQSLSMIRLYAAFNLHVTCNNDKAGVLLAEADRLEDAKSKEHRAEGSTRLPIMSETPLDVWAENTGLITISATPRDVGIIRSVNAAACKLTGFTRLQLERRSVFTLLPAGLSELHEESLRSYVASGEGEPPVVGYSRIMLAMSKSGTILPIISAIRDAPAEDDGPPIFIWAMRELRTNMQFILLDNTFGITAVSAGSQSLLGVDLNSVSNKDATMTDFIEEWALPAVQTDLLSSAGTTLRVDVASTNPSMHTGMHTGMHMGMHAGMGGGGAGAGGLLLSPAAALSSPAPMMMNNSTVMLSPGNNTLQRGGSARQQPATGSANQRVSRVMVSDADSVDAAQSDEEDEDEGGADQQQQQQQQQSQRQAAQAMQMTTLSSLRSPAQYSVAAGSNTIAGRRASMNMGAGGAGGGAGLETTYIRAHLQPVDLGPRGAQKGYVLHWQRIPATDHMSIAKAEAKRASYMGEEPVVTLGAVAGGSAFFPGSPQPPASGTAAAAAAAAAASAMKRSQSAVAFAAMGSDGSGRSGSQRVLLGSSSTPAATLPGSLAAIHEDSAQPPQQQQQRNLQRAASNNQLSGAATSPAPVAPEQQWQGVSRAVFSAYGPPPTQLPAQEQQVQAQQQQQQQQQQQVSSGSNDSGVTPSRSGRAAAWVEQQQQQQQLQDITTGSGTGGMSVRLSLEPVPEHQELHSPNLARGSAMRSSVRERRDHSADSADNGHVVSPRAPTSGSSGMPGPVDRSDEVGTVRESRHGSVKNGGDGEDQSQMSGSSSGITSTNRAMTRLRRILGNDNPRLLPGLYYLRLAGVGLTLLAIALSAAVVIITRNSFLALLNSVHYSELGAYRMIYKASSIRSAQDLLYDGRYWVNLTAEERADARSYIAGNASLFARAHAEMFALAQAADDPRTLAEWNTRYITLADFTLNPFAMGGQYSQYNLAEVGKVFHSLMLKLASPVQMPDERYHEYTDGSAGGQPDLSLMNVEFMRAGNGHETLLHSMQSGYVATVVKSQQVERTQLIVYLAMSISVIFVGLVLFTPILRHIDSSSDAIMLQFVRLPIGVRMGLYQQASRRVRMLRRDYADEDDEGAGDTSEEEEDDNGGNQQGMFGTEGRQMTLGPGAAAHLLPGGDDAASTSVDWAAALASGDAETVSKASSRLGRSSRMVRANTHHRDHGDGHSHGHHSSSSKRSKKHVKAFRKSRSGFIMFVLRFCSPLLALLVLFSVTFGTFSVVNEQALVLTSIAVAADSRAACARQAMTDLRKLSSITTDAQYVTNSFHYTIDSFECVRKHTRLLAYGVKGSGLEKSDYGSHTEPVESGTSSVLSAQMVRHVRDTMFADACPVLATAAEARGEHFNVSECRTFRGGLVTLGLAAVVEEVFRTASIVADRQLRGQFIVGKLYEGYGWSMPAALFDYSTAGCIKALGCDLDRSVSMPEDGSVLPPSPTGNSSYPGDHLDIYGPGQGTVPPGSTRYYVSQEVNHPDVQFLLQTDREYLTPGLVYLADLYTHEANAAINNYISFLIIFVPAYLTAFVAVMATVFQGLVIGANREIISKRAMLLYLPVPVVAKVRTIRTLIDEIVAADSDSGSGLAPGMTLATGGGAADTTSAGGSSQG